MTSALPHKELIARISDARHQIEASEAALASAESDLTERTAQLSSAEQELERLLTREKDDLVARILDGAPSRPSRPRRLTRIENLKQEIEGLKLALPLLQGKVNQSKGAVASAKDAYASAILPAICAERSSALEELRAALGTLSPILVRLAAPDAVQERLVGKHFTFTGEQPEIFSGAMVVRRFVQHLADRLRPPELEIEVIDQQVGVAADQLVNALKGE